MGKRRQEREQGNKQGEGGELKVGEVRKCSFTKQGGCGRGGGFDESQTFLLVRLCLVNYAGFNWQVQAELKVLGFIKDRIE